MTCYRLEVLCFDCVRQRCRELQFKEQLAEHSRFINAALKQPADRSVGGVCLAAAEGSVGVAFSRCHGLFNNNNIYEALFF